ncbi:hypothetical protein FACS1894188_03020 [Clostridia bacterium]|nr:hypothetical protein FACS1894188_03020 [Clostridia bacterium]
MKIISIYAAVNGRDYGLKPLSAAIYNTFRELGCEISEINASNIIPEKSAFRDASGVLLIYATELLAPCAPMSALLCSLWESGDYAELAGKHVFTITAGKGGGFGEPWSLSYIGEVLRLFGASDTIRLPLTENLLNSPVTAETADKYAEDFYRIIRQNRAVLPAASFGTHAAPSISQEEYNALMTYEKEPRITREEIGKKYKLDEEDSKQDADILEITQFFAGKYKESVTKDANITPNSSAFANPFTAVPAPIARDKTARQMTQSMVHKFQPPLAAGLTAAIQLNIFGAETFDGYFNINNTECEFTDGVVDSPDLTIMCDGSIWLDILNGKFSAQKAFMIGHLKVRGNFVLLTRFDQIFKH